MYYTTEMRVRHYDCDYSDLLKLSSAIKYMQHNSSNHLEDLGFSMEQLLERNMVFLLTKIIMKIYRMPRNDEVIRAGTAVVGNKGVRFLREYVLDTSKGEHLLSAMSHWVLANPVTHKLYRPSSFPYQFDIQAPNTEIMDDLEIPKGGDAPDESRSIRVRYSHLDSNRHVNNTVYADFVCDLLPFEELTGRGLDTVVLCFQNEAVINESIALIRRKCAQGSYTVMGSIDTKPCFEAFVKMK